VKRFSGQIAAHYAGAGAVRWAACGSAVPVMSLASRHRAPLFVEIDSLTPQGEAKAP
jgi:hypothetical protein